MGAVARTGGPGRPGRARALARIEWGEAARPGAGARRAGEFGGWRRGRADRALHI
jgi:hypothetical protein